MSRENPRNQEWAVYYDEHPEVLANWREQNGYPPHWTDEEEAAGVNSELAAYLHELRKEYPWTTFIPDEFWIAKIKEAQEKNE